MDLRNRRMEIFKQVQDGRLTLEEASRLLAVVDREFEPAGSPVPGGFAAEGAAPAALSPLGSKPADPPKPGVTPLETRTSNGMLDPNPIESDARPPKTPSAVENQDQNPLGREPRLQNSQFSNGSRAANPLEKEPPPPTAVPAEVIAPQSHSPIWQGWWLLVFVPGLLLLVAAANWMYEGFLAARLGWGFWLAFIPFTLGILMVWLGWEIRMARWLYIHIRQRPGAAPRELTISLPLPTGWVSWLIRQAGRFSPHLRGTQAGDLMDEIDQAVTRDGPLQISVDDPKGGQIEIWMDGPKK